MNDERSSSSWQGEKPRVIALLVTDSAEMANDGKGLWRLGHSLAGVACGEFPNRLEKLFVFVSIRRGSSPQEIFELKIVGPRGLVGQGVAHIKQFSRDGYAEHAFDTTGTLIRVPGPYQIQIFNRGKLIAERLLRIGAKPPATDRQSRLQPRF